MNEYHKIDGLYMREESTKRLLPGVYRNPLVEYLKDNEWTFTEKIDGTNIRVVWDGHRVSFHGRTDKAMIPVKLLQKLEELFGGEANEQVFEQYFGDKLVTLYGEGYGAGIQKGGGNYRKDNDFILFDVEVNDSIMLARKDVELVAQYFGIEVVPIIMTGTILEAEDFVRSRPMSKIGTAKMEGLVGRPTIEIMDRCGKRVIVKIKTRDYDEIERYDS